MDIIRILKISEHNRIKIKYLGGEQVIWGMGLRRKIKDKYLQVFLLSIAQGDVQGGTVKESAGSSHRQEIPVLLPLPFDPFIDLESPTKNIIYDIKT